MKKEKQKRLIKKSILFLFAITISIYIVFAILGLIQKPTDTFVIEKGRLSEEETAQGYIIRDEEVITGQNYKNGMAQIKTEGERVAKDEAIFRYYTSGEENLVKQIQELDVKIQEAWEKDNNTIFSSDIKLIENQIEQKLNDAYQLNNMQKLKETKKDINQFITKKAKIAGELSPAGSYLKGLIDQRSQYENQLNSGSEYIKATKAGIVSYRVDGLEAILSPNSFGNLSKKMLNDLNLKTGQIVTTSEESGKIIDNFSCYIACVLNSKEANETVVGEEVRLRLSNAKEIEAQVEYTARQSDTENLIVFRIHSCIEELISYRKISFDVIWWEANGWKVPNSAIHYKTDDLAYVVRKRSGYTDDIYVKVLKQNKEYAIIDNYSYSDLEKKLNEIKTENEQEAEKIKEDKKKAGNGMKLSLYDEIVT